MNVVDGGMLSVFLVTVKWWYPVVVVVEGITAQINGSVERSLVD